MHTIPLMSSSYIKKKKKSSHNQEDFSKSKFLTFDLKNITFQKGIMIIESLFQIVFKGNYS